MVGATSTLLNATPRLLSRTPDCLLWPDQRSMLVVDSAEDSAVNGLPAQPYDIIFPSKVLPLLAIDLRASRRIAKATYACEAGQATLSSSPSRKLAICQDRANGHILIDAPMEKVLVPELYAHIVDGVELNGIYLGVENQTTWGFRYTPATCHANATLSTRDYYEVKLLGLPESKWDTAGYEILMKIKLVGYALLGACYFTPQTVEVQLQSQVECSDQFNGCLQVDGGTACVMQHLPLDSELLC
ncbi:hypothetical protein SNOG_05801 [Parastagonospora nodorum SN15]|uniref:Uncharacterized protein n=1 Tax=Phaeosphaeria nodorum (strain SN15 / ATCC MYA-4574 / FGSC 10173) TaxID=321614 RepID=Q0UR13_PHANO|nr:hypothetical protein SNOG_05801 [Parastagonospora nodorum SN15]EAT86865.1 hypothetical protein SNOG_05801 [Parastagonospora nodorum SN15]